ncbi:MAG: hypothetical protein U0R65_02515 [Candidatus Nanopelagicales bacterium]
MGGSGLGYLIFNSRALFKIEDAFVGIVVVAFLGYTLQPRDADRRTGHPLARLRSRRHRPRQRVQAARIVHGGSAMSSPHTTCRRLTAAVLALAATTLALAACSSSGAAESSAAALPSGLDPSRWRRRPRSRCRSAPRPSTSARCCSRTRSGSSRRRT